MTGMMIDDGDDDDDRCQDVWVMLRDDGMCELGMYV